MVKQNKREGKKEKRKEKKRKGKKKKLKSRRIIKPQIVIKKEDRRAHTTLHGKL